MAPQCDLVLVIGSRNSSNSNRLVEVSRELGTEAHLIDNEVQVQESWLEGKPRGRHHLGGQRPRDARAAARATSSARAARRSVEEFEVVQEDVRFMLPKTIRQALAAQSA